MVFVPPSWIWGAFVYGIIHLIPVVVGFICMLIGVGIYEDNYFSNKINYGTWILALLGIFIIVGGSVGASYVLHEMYEVPSVQEEIITVDEWQPVPSIQPNENGIISINSANDLMLITKDGKCFYNQENMWFSKFETRDIFNKLKVNGTYKIKYYGWRNGQNNGFPNILSVEKVIDESNASPNKYSDYFGARLSVNGEQFN